MSTKNSLSIHGRKRISDINNKDGENIMITVNNKFDIGEECYSIYRKPTHYSCPICEGEGEFVHNGYMIRCINCSGSGKLHNPEQSVLAVCKVKVRCVVSSIYENQTTVRYGVNGIDDDLFVRINSRSENHLFKTREEAEEYCIEMNTKQIKPEF